VSGKEEKAVKQRRRRAYIDGKRPLAEPPVLWDTVKVGVQKWHAMSTSVGVTYLHFQAARRMAVTSSILDENGSQL
jgi:hypothetical protein